MIDTPLFQRAPKPTATKVSALRLYRTEGGVTRSYALTGSVCFTHVLQRFITCHIRPRGWRYTGEHTGPLGSVRLGPGGRTEIR